jgi:ribonucleotide reductase, class II
MKSATGAPLIYRSYSRRQADGSRESWDNICKRTNKALVELGKLPDNLGVDILRLQLLKQVMPSGRWLWIGGTRWMQKPENVYGGYNCASATIKCWADFGLLMNLAMQGTGTGAILENNIRQLPAVSNRLHITLDGEIGTAPENGRQESTSLFVEATDRVHLTVGDSREGWVDAYRLLLELSSDTNLSEDIHVTVDLSSIRPAGTPLKGFGGTANPARLPTMFTRVAEILGDAVGRQLSAVECCLLIDEAAACVVAGNIRRCLASHVHINMADGTTKSIGNIQVGDLVKTPAGQQPVTDKFDQGEQQCWRITLENDVVLEATSMHKFAVHRPAHTDVCYEWAKVIDLDMTDSLMRLNGTELVPVKIRQMSPPKELRDTWDIEVAEEHCFFAEGILSHNSAGMRQGSSGDTGFAAAKENLWQQDDEGNWSIDPKRDSLRMANHTRVYHHKPTQQEVTDAVRKQFHSGEGAIQYAPEAIARANADLLYNDGWKKQFIRAYEAGNGREFLRQMFDPAMPERELSHRLGRYGLNPCLVAGTMVVTLDGHYPIEELVGKSTTIWDGERWLPIDNFRVTGYNQKVYTVTTQAGDSFTATATHNCILADGTKKPVEQLATGDCLMTHEVLAPGVHHVAGAYIKGYMLAQAGTPMVVEPHDTNARLGASLDELSEEAGVLSPYERVREWLTKNANVFPADVVNWRSNNKFDFVAGLFDAAGKVIDGQFGFSYYYVDQNRAWLAGLQLLLHTMGIKSDITADAEGSLCLTVYRHGAIYLSSTCEFENLTSFADRTVGYPDKTGGNKVISVEFSHTAELVFCCTVPTTHKFALSNGYMTGNCGEIIGEDFLCNLSEVHLNTLDPQSEQEQTEAFAAAGIIAATLLHQKFPHERQQYSREIDPIVGVSFTGLFDFFVNLFGVDWLKWWEAGRSASYPGAVDFLYAERQHLTRWRIAASDAVSNYCNQHGLRVPNRCTTVQPAGSKSLITGASPGWHPPKAQRYIRRMTFRKDDPIALACIDMGYSVIPSPSDKDSNGVLLNDPFDPRCTEWLVEFPVKVVWADLPGADQIAIEKFSAVAQFDFYMQVQQYYTTHNTSATIELREDEIEPLAQVIHDSIANGTGYISAALLARTDASFPRMPFEPIDKATYENMLTWVQTRATQTDFHTALARHDSAAEELQGPAGCDSDKCTMPEKKPG